MHPTLPHLCPTACRVLATASLLPEIQTGPSTPGLPEFDGAFLAGPTPPSGHPMQQRDLVKRDGDRGGTSLYGRCRSLWGRVRGNKEGQGAVRASIRHRPCSRRRRPTTGRCAQQRRSTSARQAGEARDRTRHHTPRHRAEVRSGQTWNAGLGDLKGVNWARRSRASLGCF